jgi:hypothetical protein
VLEVLEESAGPRRIKRKPGVRLVTTQNARGTPSLARPSLVFTTALLRTASTCYRYSCLILPQVVDSVGVGLAVPQLSVKSIPSVT